MQALIINQEYQYYSQPQYSNGTGYAAVPDIFSHATEVILVKQNFRKPYIHLKLGDRDVYIKPIIGFSGQEALRLAQIIQQEFGISSEYIQWWCDC